MNCDIARLQIGPDPGPRPQSDVVDAALNHVATCPACQAFYASQTALVKRLAALRSEPTPSRLRARILAATAQRPRGRRRWQLGAALATVAAVIFLVTMRLPDGNAIAEPLVAAARSQLAQTTTFETGAINEAEAWLEREIGYPVVVPDIREAALVGARVSVIGGQRSAIVVYLARGMPVTYFALPTGDMMGRRIRDPGVISGASDGYEVAIWTEDGQTRAIAAPMTRPEIIELANDCRSKASTD